MDKRAHTSLEYYLHGASPRILLFSGMHGDEYESGTLLRAYLKKNSAALPDFLYIPCVSPSAVASKTRKNMYGHDINRQFTENTTDEEARTVMSLLRPFHFDLCIDVHEDPDRTMGFYLYDSEHMSESELYAYREAVHTTDARLYTGVDDMDDEHLNLHVEKGYVSLGYDQSVETAGFSSRWLYEKNICKRTFTLEVPGKAPRELKESLIRVVISVLLNVNTSKHS